MIFIIGVVATGCCYLLYQWTYYFLLGNLPPCWLGSGVFITADNKLCFCAFL